MIAYPEIDPVAIAIGPLQVHWYGITYLVGFAVAWWLGVRMARRSWTPLEPKQVEDLLFYGVIGVIVGGRLGYALFYGWEQLVANPLWLFRVWEGGMSFHGGLLGVGLAMWLYARHLGQPVGAVFDFVAPMTPIGLGCGRIGNFIGQELWGRATDLPWAMVFPRDPLQLPRHPSQLYQAFLEGVVLFAIVWLFARKPRPTLSVTGVFLSCYGLFRFLVEFAREPDAHIGFDLMGWITRGQLLSLPMVIGGVALIWIAYHNGTSPPGAEKQQQQ